METINNVIGPSSRGINESTINQLNLDIYDYVEKINNTFSQMETLVNESREFFISDEGDLFRQRFESISANFPIVCQNILSYVSDLNNARTGLINISNRVSLDTLEASDNIGTSSSTEVERGNNQWS